MTSDFQQQLTAFRNDIDSIDVELIRLLCQRAQIVQNVGKLKAGAGIESFSRPEREAQILRRICELNTGPLPDEDIVRLFRELISSCMALEQPLRVAFLGPLGTFSEGAAIKHFGQAVARLPQNTIDAAFREVEAGRADFAMVPIENSTEGAVGRTLDLLTSSPLKICGETVLRIRQNLLSNEGELKAIGKVYSHAQSLAQCQEWLDQHMPWAERVPVASNAHAAQMVRHESGVAAIAGEVAAECYQLPILAQGIEDVPNNTTRFVILGKQDVLPSGKDKTSLVMSAQNRTGALFSLLSAFSEAGVSMTRLESRPARNNVWEYVFFVDIEGHQQDVDVRLALTDLAQRASWYKVLGSYPVSVL